MMHLDDFDALEIACRLLGKAHHQHGADGEVWNERRADPTRQGEGCEAGLIGERPTARPDDGRNAVHDRLARDGDGSRIEREVDEDIRCGVSQKRCGVGKYAPGRRPKADQRRQLLAVVRSGEAANQLEIGRVGDRGAGGAPHSTERAGDCDARACHGWRVAYTFSRGAYLSMSILRPTFGKSMVIRPSPPAPRSSATVPSPHFGWRALSPTSKPASTPLPASG